VARLVTQFKSAGRKALRHPLARAAAIRVAARRGHGLVLVYHRVRDDGDVPRNEVVPSLGRSRLRAQLEALGDLGDVVDLPQLLESPAGRNRPRFALTFDDDYPHHTAHALPVLRDVGVPGTFFLSGRVLHGLGPYWWERLEALIAVRGLAEAGRALEIPGDNPQVLAAACETSAHARARLEAIAPRPVEDPLNVDGISALVAAGMTLGFHTLEHPLLMDLDGHQLAAALTTGRRQLAAVAGRPLTLFAYPHGKADQRVARAVHAASYAAAWTGWPQPFRVGGDRFLLGRWEPGPLEVDSFVAAVAVRLNRAAPATALGGASRS
jgi:peptidoglycan/xylan/chitin deacetylase (PgdA/CDA1 family)